MPNTNCTGIARLWAPVMWVVARSHAARTSNLKRPVARPAGGVPWGVGKAEYASKPLILATNAYERPCAYVVGFTSA
jgi:hypothetical protein